MVPAAFTVICMLGAGFLAVFFVAICKDSSRHRKCKAVEHLLGANYEIDLNRPYETIVPHPTRPIPIEHGQRKNATATPLGTGTSGIAD